MKKHEAVESVDRAGQMIGDVNTRIWNVALHPTEYGWAASLASIAAIPVLSTASLGQMVSHAVISQIPSDVFDTIPNFGSRPPGDDDKSQP